MLPLYDYINNNLPECHMVNNTKLEDLIFDEKGKVIGVELKENYRFMMQKMMIKKIQQVKKHIIRLKKV